MMTILAFLALISYAYGQHAHCYMQLTVSDTSGGSLTIQTLNDSLVKMVQSRMGNTSACVYYSQGAEFCGYSIVSMSTTDNHFQHTTPVHHYTDDINFSEWTQSGSDVVVQADSKSEPTSIGDYDTNFCNIFNLFRNGNAHSMNYDLKFKYTECTSSHHPNTDNGYDAAYKQCDTY